MTPTEAIVLPLWVEYVKALGTPVVAFIAACVAGVIAHRQWVTAKNKLKLEFFDRRMEIYKLAVEVLDEMRRSSMSSLDSVLELEKALRSAPWIFDKKLTLYLADFCLRAVEMHKANQSTGGSQLEAYHSINDNNKVYSRERFYQAEKGQLDQEFSKFLELTH